MKKNFLKKTDLQNFKLNKYQLLRNNAPNACDFNSNLNQDNSTLWHLFHFDILRIGEWEINVVLITLCSDYKLKYRFSIPNFITISIDTSSTVNTIHINDYNLVPGQRGIGYPTREGLLSYQWRILNFIPTKNFLCNSHLNMKLLLHEGDVILLCSDHNIDHNLLCICVAYG